VPGQGVIQDVSATLVKTFATNLAEMLSGPEPATEEAPPPAPAEQPAPTAEQSLPVGAIAKSVVIGRLREPRFLLGLLVLAVLVFLLVRAVT
jgi:hypothetical protein